MIDYFQKVLENSAVSPVFTVCCENVGFLIFLVSTGALLDLQQVWKGTKNKSTTSSVYQC